MQFRRKYQRRSYIDITPMIDVIFNLLLFFIVIAFLQNRQGIKINLPAAENSAKESATRYSVIAINEKQEYFIDGKKIERTGIPAALKKSMETAEDKTLFIRAAGKVPHEIVVGIMDLAKQVGFLKLSIATKKSNAGR